MEAITKILKDLGYTSLVLTWGIDVYRGKEIVFHGREDEIIEWLKLNEEWEK